MADFTTHITTSTALGCGYAAIGAYHGLSIEASLVAGGLCGISGMLPDIDSESGVPLREIMSFAAAVVPMLMLERFTQLGLNHEQLVMAAGATYLFVRFAVTRLISRYTVHRGMFHSIPALLTFTGLAFLICGSVDLQLRYYKAGGVFIGTLSHLLLDEMYAVEWKRGRWQFKKSFGTALKLWGGSWAGNLSAYAKLALVVVMILSEPSIMQKYGRLSPIVINNDEWRERLAGQFGAPPSPPLPSSRPGEDLTSTWPPSTWPPSTWPPSTWVGPRPQFANAGTARNSAETPATYGPANQGPQFDPRTGEPLRQRDRTIYDTARRLWRRMAE